MTLKLDGDKTYDNDKYKNFINNLLGYESYITVYDLS